MRNFLLIIGTLFLAGPTFAQFNAAAPWMTSFNQEDLKSNRVRFYDIVDAFNAYWETRDPDAKGSGYKPFKRWESYWENFVDQDGYLPSSNDIWQTFQSKKLLSETRSNRAISDWQPYGPFSHVNTGSWSSGQGRINVAVQDPNNGLVYYAGAPAGGVWKSTDGGENWMPLSDDLGQIGVSGIAVDFNDSNIVYIATGDDDAGDSYSIGVFKSTDGGMTWQETGLNATNSPNNTTDLFINPNDSNVLWLASAGGVYKSTDAGATWNVKISGNFKALDIKPGDPSVVYAMTSDQFFRSTDGGETFVQTTSGLPVSAGRLAMDVTPANPEVVYVLAANGSNNFGGVFKSTDSGETFVQTAAPLAVNILESSQAWYDLAIAVSANDENKVFTGCLNIWRSTDGGDSFTKLNSWSNPSQATYTHADIHYMQYFGDTFFVGSDGGIYRSFNDGDNFADLTEGIQVSQFYRLAVAESDSNLMIGGLQDNGGYGYSNNTWNNYYGADGMDTAINPNDPNIYYGFIQNGGNLYVSNDAGASLQQVIGGPASGNWITPLSINPEGELFAGYSRLFKLVGDSFQAVSTELGSNIDCLELDPSNSDIIYVALNNILRKSTDGGENFTAVALLTSNITSIEVNNNDNNIVYVTTSGTGGQVLRSTNGGLNFDDITSGLPFISKNVIKHRAEDPAESIYVGTSLGVYSYDDQTGVWEAFDTNLPNVSVRDLEINILDGNITAATYGRGVWRSVLPEVEAPANDIKLADISSPVGHQTNCDPIFIPQINIKNNGSEEISSFDLIYFYDTDSPVTSNFNTTIAPGATISIDLPQVTLSVGEHILNVEASIANDAFETNNSREVAFSVNASGVLNEVNTLENDAQNLLAFNESDDNVLFQRGVPSGIFLNDSSSGTQAYATNLSGNYPDMTIAYLYSACYDLTNISDPILQFDMAFELEPDWDLIYMQYSTDIGETWEILGNANDSNWYNSSRLSGDGVANNCYNCVGAQWTGTELSLTQYSYNLAAFEGSDKFMVRFVFHSDQSVTEEGVVIDDIVVSSALSTQNFRENQFTFYPNPTSSDVTIKLSQTASFRYTITDLTGKVISQPGTVFLTDHLTISLEDVSVGLYFITLDFHQGEKVTKKLIKQ